MAKRRSKDSELEKLLSGLRESMAESVERWDDLTFGPKELRRRGHVGVMPADEWASLQADRKRRFEAWRKLTDELLSAGVLEHEHCFECPGELRLNDERPAEWIYDETEAEYRERVPQPYHTPYIRMAFGTKTVTIPKEGA